MQRRWAVALVAILLVAGVGYGALWAAVAPTELLRAEDSGLFPVASQPEAEFAAQAVFAGIGVLIGVVAGLVTWRNHRDRPITAALLLAFGGLLCGLIAAAVGIRLGPTLDAASVPVGETADAPLRIDATAALFAVAIGAVGALLVCLLVQTEPEESAAPEATAEEDLDDQRAIGSTEAPVTDTRSEGDSPMSSPRLPPET
jgi:hypothetical protein